MTGQPDEGRTAPLLRSQKVLPRRAPRAAGLPLSTRTLLAVSLVSLAAAATAAPGPRIAGPAEPVVEQVLWELQQRGVTTGEPDLWVQEAGDTMVGDLRFSDTADATTARIRAQTGDAQVRDLAARDLAARMGSFSGLTADAASIGALSAGAATVGSLTSTGQVSAGGFDARGARVVGLAAPAAASDAATKGYVDGKVLGSTLMRVEQRTFASSTGDTDQVVASFSPSRGDAFLLLSYSMSATANQCGTLASGKLRFVFQDGSSVLDDISPAFCSVPTSSKYASPGGQVLTQGSSTQAGTSPVWQAANGKSLVRVDLIQHTNSPLTSVTLGFYAVEV